jgi:hypothetical protein
MAYFSLLSDLQHLKLHNAILRDDSQLDWYRVTGSVFVAVFLFKVIKLLFRTVCSYFFSPLGRFPGPRLAAASELWEIYHTLKSKWQWQWPFHLKIRAVHKF